MARCETLRRRGRRAEQACGPVGSFAPVAKQYPDVGHRVTERADLPVENRPHASVLAEHGVVEAVVAVDHRDSLLLRDRRRQLVGHGLDEAPVVDALDVHLLVLGSPTTKLAFDVAVVSREIAETGRVDVDVVQLGERLGEVITNDVARRHVERGFGLGPVAQDRAVDELHDVERSFVDRFIDAQSQWLRDRDAEGEERRDDGVLADHVVRRGQDVTGRWATKGEPSPAGVSDAKRQVRTTTGDELEFEWGDGSDVLAHPRRHAGFVYSRRRTLHVAKANSGERPSHLAACAVRLVNVTDVTDATFATAVMERSMSVPVVVDLWAEWCGPCKTLGPILEKVIGETNGAVELVKVDVDANPSVSQAFAVQSIPAVFAVHEGKIVDTFVGALPESAVREFIEKLAPGATQVDRLLDEGDETSLRAALELDSSNLDAAVALGDLLRTSDRLDEAEALLVPFEHVVAAKTVLARIRLQRSGVALTGDVDLTLEHLLEQSGTDEKARASLLEVLDALGPDDPRYVSFRRRLASRLY